MGQIVFRAKFPIIEAQNQSKFMSLLATAVDLTKAEEGNELYEYFMNADNSACVVLERYSNSAAVMQHMSGMSEILPQLMRLGGGLEAECFGSPSPELTEALEGVPIYRPVDG